METTMKTTTTTTIEKKVKDFATTHAAEVVGENYPEPENKDDQEQLDETKEMIVKAMMAMVPQVVKHLSPAAETSEVSMGDLAGKLDTLIQLQRQTPKATQPATVAKAVEPAETGDAPKGKRTLSAYNVWAKQEWYTQGRKEAPPAGHWEHLCSEDPKLKARFQALADQQNETEGRISRKGIARSAPTTVAGWTLLLRRMGELNKTVEPDVRLKSSDLGPYKVLGADKKVDGAQSIVKLEEYYNNLWARPKHTKIKTHKNKNTNKNKNKLCLYPTNLTFRGK